MTAHDHREIVPGCYRCELGRDEARDAIEDHLREMAARQDAVQALLGVLNDIGGGNPWNYNVITEAAEDALDAALRVVGQRMAERVKNFGGFQRGEFWIAQNDVLRLIDEMTALAPEEAR
jgi:hypothetical protein